MLDYRITLCQHLYSASVCIKSSSLIVSKLNYMVQYFILFPMIYTKLGHKLTNVGMARINESTLILMIIERNARTWTLQ
jgi:hypothetical protein